LNCGTPVMDPSTTYSVVGRSSPLDRSTEYENRSGVGQSSLFHPLKYKYLLIYSIEHLRLRDYSSRNTPPGDPNGGVVYLRIVLSPEEASLHLYLSININIICYNNQHFL
jgi:hypothetical protein